MNQEMEAVMVKHKRGICMADGGITRKETADELMARMTAKYGAPAAGPVQAPPPPQAAPQPAPAPVQPTGSGKGILGILKGRKEQIDKAVGYANGGIPGRVKFEGKGGPRDDQIPVKVAGQKVNVSDGEQALIIPAKTAANAQAMESIKRIIAESNDGRQPDMGQGGDNYANGGLLDDEAQNIDYQKVTGIAAPSPTPQPAAQPQGGGWGLGKSGPGATLQVTTGDAARLPGAVQQQGINAMRGQMATPQPAAAAGSNYVGNGPTDPDVNGRQSISAPSATVQRGIATMRGQLNQNPMASENARNAAAAESNVRSLYPAGTFDAPENPMAAASRTVQSAVSVPAMGAEEAAIRAKHDAVMNGQQSAADPAALAALKATPKLITAESAQSAMGNPMRRSGGISGSIDMAGVNGIMERENAARQSMIDAQRTDTQPGGGFNALTDQNAIDNAEKTARWRQDDLLAKAARNPAAGQVAAISAQGQNQRESEEARAASVANVEAGRNALVMRGQDITAQRGAADEQLKGAQAQGIMAQTDSTRMLADIQKKALAGDPQAMAYYRALTQKGADYKDRYITLPNRKVYNEMGQIVGEESGGVFDAATGKPVQTANGQQKTSANVPQAGEVRGGYKFKGGNPADKASWEKV
jgi:hypothetical protein